ncbi:hypothetical protein DOY81_000651 [Sarcophaga bullata]|nr:hypothetical protein DOY81_000651 [Sarcophaga bullata]
MELSNSVQSTKIMLQLCCKNSLIKEEKKKKTFKAMFISFERKMM